MAFVTPVVEHWLEREIAQWVHPMKDRSNDPLHHERTLYLWATSRCHHIGYSFRLTARVLLYAPSHRQDNTYHSLCYTSRGALAGTRNSSMGPPWRIDPMTHRTMSERSTSELRPAPLGSRHSSVVEHPLMVQWVSDPKLILKLWFSFQVALLVGVTQVALCLLCVSKTAVSAGVGHRSTIDSVTGRCK